MLFEVLWVPVQVRVTSFAQNHFSAPPPEAELTAGASPGADVRGRQPIG